MEPIPTCWQAGVIILAIWLIAFLANAWWMSHAPAGREDEDGFHREEKPDD